MIDTTLQELWSVKDKLAQEHAYDLDSLVFYLQDKYPPKPETKAKIPTSDKTIPAQSATTAAK